MVKDKHNPIPKFIMLVEDDMLYPGDEYYDYNDDVWYPIESKHIGELYRGPFGYDHFLVLRRKNKKYEK